MNLTTYAVRLGLSRGWQEFKISRRSADEVGFNLVFVLVFCAVLFFQRDTSVEGTSQSLANLMLPGIVGMMVAFGGILGVAGILAVERDDGTLLRAKAVPNGMLSYLVAKVTGQLLGTLTNLAILLVAGLFIVSDLLSTPLLGWLGLLAVIVLGLLAVLPWGAIVGALIKNPQSAFGVSALTVGTLAAISGIFYPVTAMPEWLQGIAQVFPVYWLGLGMRSALLPDSALGVEIGESWRHVEMVAVLGGWAIVGLLVAPPILRRMARRESGSTMEERRLRAMRRVG